MLSSLANKVNEFKGDLKIESIIQVLKELPFQNFNKIINIDNYFRMMLEESHWKFKALGMLVYHLVNNTAAYKRTRLYFDSI